MWVDAAAYEKPRESRGIAGHDMVVLLLLFNIYRVPKAM